MKHFRFLFYSIAIAILGYGVWALMNDGEQIAAAISQVGFGGMALLCALSLFNYLLRYLRWFLMLRHLGDRPAFIDGLLCYCAGFALTTTPGKAGEAVRTFYFKTRHGVDHTHTFAALLAERISDLLSAMLLASLVLFTLDHFHWLAWALIGGCAAVMLAILRPKLLLQTLEKLRHVTPARLHPLLDATPRFMQRTAALLSVSVLSGSVLLGVISWGAEGVGFAWLAQPLGSTASWYALVSMFALSMIAGVFMPGGLGGTEAAMAALLVTTGLGPAEAFVVALLCRLATLWFAILLGVLTMLWLGVPWQTREAAP